MNIAIQCCALVVILIVLFFYLSCKKVFLNTEKTFLSLMCASVISIIFDIVSVVFIYYWSNKTITFIVSKMYLITIMSVAHWALLYIYSSVYGKDIHFKRMSIVLGIMSAAGIVAIATLPFEIVRTDSYLYSTGASAYMTFIICGIYLFASSLILVKYKNVINKKRRDAVAAWIAFWVAAAVIQFVYKDILVVSFAISMGIMIIYIKLENPESAIDRETGLFNQNSFRPYVKHRFVNNTPFSLIMITFDNLNKTPSKESIFRKKEIISLISDVEDTVAFKTNDDDLYILYDSKATADKMCETLRGRYLNDSNEDMKPHISYIPYSGVIDDVEDMFHALRYAGQTATMADKKFVCIDEEFKNRMTAVQRIEELVNDAIENNRIEVFYQPIYSTEKRIFTSAEALVRIRDDEGKLIPPATFIEIAERNGTILKLGEVVFENVCRLISESDIMKYGLEYIEVNLSVVQCEYENLAKEFIDIMRKYNVPGGLINLEITETATMASKKKLINNMIALRNYGVGFSLDDFGTGQSNLNYIVDMPVDIVKFDRGMTSAYFESNKAKYVMDAAMHMIHGMKLDIVSEGVETEEQLETMRNLGIQYVQGYYFSKPLPESEYLEYIHKSNYEYYRNHKD